MLSTIFSIATLASAPVLAGPSEFSLELGSFGAPDDNWEMFNENGAVGTWGLRYGHRLGDNLSLLVGWHRSVDGGAVYADYADDEDWDWDYEPDFHTKFVTNRVTVGPKVHYDVARWFAPYATAQAVGWLGRIYVDDDIEDDENANELRFGALAPGVLGALGVDFKPIRLGDKVRLATNLEMGYGITSRLHFKDKNGEADGEKSPVGELGFRGFYVDWGVGLRF